MFVDKLRQLRSVHIEVVACFGVYIVYISYGFWALCSIRDRVLEIAKYEFEPGWTIVGRPRDATSDDLQNFTAYVRKVWPWLVAHVAVSVLVRHHRPQHQSGVQAAVCIAALIHMMRPLSLLIVAVLLISYYWAAHIGSKRLIWLLLGSWMFILFKSITANYFYDTLGYAESINLLLIISWSVLRCCSYALSNINDRKAGTAENPRVPYTIEHFLGYTLYLPCIFYGPFLSYQRYIAHLKPPKQKSQPLPRRILQLAWELFRVAFWYFMLQLALHFIYVHYMSQDYRAVALLGSAFTQYALVYFMGQFFFIYYIISYGLGIALARFDGLDPPNRPRCIGRVHFYSDMWKHFDQGLYEFLFQHIYAELCGKGSPLYHKLLANVATFAFAVVWHGCAVNVLVWSALNFGCVVAEKYLLAALASRWYVSWTSRHLSGRSTQRLRALLGSQLFIPAAFSNVYFFGGLEVGNYFMRSAYLSGLGNYISLTVCCYCFFQCSEVILNLSKNKSDLSCKSGLNESNGSNKKIS